ncbi:unnamed protein product, partial [marine sediment metagenome]
MSRSYYKSFINKDCGVGEKKLANRKVRRTKNIPNGGSYRNVYSRYDICDWKYECTFREWMKG